MFSLIKVPDGILIGVLCDVRKPPRAEPSQAFLNGRLAGDARALRCAVILCGFSFDRPAVSCPDGPTSLRLHNLPPEARLLDLYVDAQGLGSRVGEICKKRNDSCEIIPLPTALTTFLRQCVHQVIKGINERLHSLML